MLGWDFKFRVGEIIWGLIFLYPPKLIFSPKFSGTLEKSVGLFGGLRALLDISTYVPKVK